MGERGVDDRAVQRIRRRDVHDVHRGIGGQRLEAAVGLRHAEALGLRRADASLLAATATTSTNPSRRTASM